MSYNQQLAYLAQRYQLSEDDVFALNMRIHMQALANGVLIYEVMAALIEACQKEEGKA